MLWTSGPLLARHPPLATCTATKRLIFRRGFIPEGSREETRDGIQDNRRREFTAAQDIVADGNFVGGQVYGHSFVHSFIASTNQDDAIKLRETSRCLLSEQFTRGGQKGNGRPQSAAHLSLAVPMD